MNAQNMQHVPLNMGVVGNIFLVTKHFMWTKKRFSSEIYKQKRHDSQLILELPLCIPHTSASNNPPPVNGEHQHWLQPMTLIRYISSKKAAHVGRNRSLVACTNMCGWAIRWLKSSHTKASILASCPLST
jgi:hypothetical protein